MVFELSTKTNSSKTKYWGEVGLKARGRALWEPINFHTIQ